MNFTLHLTNSCNLRCVYCTQQKTGSRMSLDTVKNLIALSMKHSRRTGFCFYGGEPMLEYELIVQIIEYCKTIDHEFSFKMSTNGLLLDEEKTEYLSENKVGIGLSHDGLMQKSRIAADGSDTLAAVDKCAKILLRHQPKAIVRAVISPQYAGLLYDSVEHLLGLGFKTIITTPAYGENVTWDDDSLLLLGKQYEKVSELYAQRFGSSDMFSYPAFEGKILSYIKNGLEPFVRCGSDFSQCSVTADGKIYPCTQLVNSEQFCIGDAMNGFDTDKIAGLSLHSSPKECEGCLLAPRCLNYCACANLMETGSIDKVSPFNCEHERLIIDVADRLGERLFAEKREQFEKAFYKR